MAIPENQKRYYGKHYLLQLASATYTTSSPYQLSWANAERGNRNWFVKNTNDNTGGVYPYLALPDARDCPLGHIFTIRNYRGAETNYVAIQDYDGTQLCIVKGFASFNGITNAMIFLIDNSTSAGVWATYSHRFGGTPSLYKANNS